ncbi:MAG: CBS domain-containing protein [Thermoproteus sp.]|jgi:CBS domain-containing protein|uniref:CBS domain-containing protein n=1 Tax=Thermoproteus sp. CP80 TaxID=1650659 RepID=UPI0007471D21|nr:CBS domain-containing protein [Thermoproteus sp. CP80]KUO85135.1 MAG: signal transduction protein [Thermoproteus sp. CIS_19]MDT7868887.1 CBS domain-containing protein [Thermoproteus sp.]MDT7880900.1 CBS domain-containing protein [Thermoproteus sp.]PLC64950.1 signal transduction protein [Thermoproteus sp. CP80]
MSSVGDLIKRSPVVASPADPIIKAVRLMADNNVGSAVLVDGSGRPVGIVTERDVIRGLARGARLEDPVESIATMGSLVTAGVKEDVYSALRKMRNRGIRHLVVVDEAGALRGVISMRDLLEDFVIKRLGERVWWPPPED